MKKKITGITLLITLIMVFIFLGAIINLIVNIEWFSEVKYLSVYFTKLTAVIKLTIPIFAVIFTVILIYYKSLKKNIQKYNSEDNVINVNKSYNKFFVIADIIISLAISISISSQYWYRILQFTNSVKFNVNDPIFNKDISFYVFKLPLIQSFYGIILTLMIFLVIITFLAYIVLNLKDSMLLKRNFINTKDFMNTKNFRSGITKFAGRQLAVVSFIILLLVSLGYLIKGWNLVYSPRGVVFGASYTDIKVSLLFYKVIAVVAFVAAIVILVSILLSKVKPIAISIVTIIALIIIENLSAVVVQNFVVKSNEKTLEKKYISYNMEYTKKAYNIENIKQQIYPLKNNLTMKDINNNSETINNIKLNSYVPSMEYYNQLQVLKYYYTFKDVDVDRYNLDNKYTQVFIAPREIDVDSLKGNANTWQNRHLTYTHGYGVVMSKVNSVTSSGKPDFVISDLPIENKSGIVLNNPRIYFGEKTDDYAIVNTKLGELDYPQGSTNKMTNYNGKAGIKMSSFNKILYSIYNKNIKFLLSRDITNESKILINRNIVDRVTKIAPFLIYDSDPYIVIDNGKLYWIVDAYTASNRYPFSEPYNNLNYIRNSVKVVIDAYDGTTNFYIADKSDPIVQSYAKIFPKLFKTFEDVPEGLKEHFRYPEDLFDLQCNVINKYHVTDPMVFYSGDDLWEISKNEKQVDANNQDNDEKNLSSYAVMKLPNNTKEKMVLLQYFNVSKKNNMIALLSTEMDDDNYGKMNLYKFPDESVDSPYLFKQNIKQDPVISKEISFWNQQGSKVVFGDTMIIPIKNSLLYVEPLYIRANGADSIPQMKRVVMAYNDKLVMDNDVKSALKSIFGESKTDKQNDSTNEQKKNDTSVNTDAADVDLEIQIKNAKELYDKAINSQKNGDWAQYGEYINQLGKLLEKLQ